MMMHMGFEVLDHPVIFATPRRFTNVTAWHGLIPVAFALIALHRPWVFVELGTHKGDSYCAFCQAVDELGLPARCYAVDTWQGDPQAGFYEVEVYEELRAYHDPLYGRFSSLLRMTFDEALSYFAEGEIDLLHIDGLHTYEAVKHDFESWLPKMSPRGVVVFHDVTVREEDFGVWRLWEEVCRRYPTRLFGFSHGLGIAAIGQAALDGGLGVWFAAGEEKWLHIQAFFAALGERWMNQDRIRALQTGLDSSRRELETVVAQIAEEHERWRRWSEEKSGEIAQFQAELKRTQEKLQRTQEELQQTQEELQRTQEELQRRRIAEQSLNGILDSWLWRGFGRYLLPVVEPAEEAASARSVELGECSPLDLPAYVWSGSGRALGGMRRFLAPLEIVGDRVSLQKNALHVHAAGARLLVRLDGFLKAAKIVLGVVEEEVQLALEFGELEERCWRPLVQYKVRVSSRRPTVFHLQLPEAAAAMAFAFPASGQVSFSQIAVIAVSPLERKLGPWLLPLQRGIVLLRSRPWRRLRRAVKRYGWRGAVHVARQRLGPAADAASPLLASPKPSADKGDPYAYIAEEGGVSLAGRRMVVLASSEGNCFMREIGMAVVQAAEKLGAGVVLGDERDKIDPQGYDWIVVVAPHEFFTLGRGIGRFSTFARQHERLLLINTEQPQTQWFRTALDFLPAARAVLDINYQTAVHLRRMGIHAYFLPIGYNHPSSMPDGALPDHPAFLHLPQEVRKLTPRNYQERPLDVVFVGTASPRRKAFFARHAGFFAGLNAFIYLPEGNVPFVPNHTRTLDFAMLSGLVRRAKIVLNIHRDEHPYLEWQRVVNLGIQQQTLVISEHCDFCPALLANGDYLDLPLELIPTVCAHYLNCPQEAEQFAQQAFARLRRELPMEKILARLLLVLETP